MTTLNACNPSRDEPRNLAFGSLSTPVAADAINESDSIIPFDAASARNRLFPATVLAERAALTSSSRRRRLVGPLNFVGDDASADDRVRQYALAPEFEADARLLSAAEWHR